MILGRDKFLPPIFWLDRKGKIISGDTHTNEVLKRIKVNPYDAREYAIKAWNWIRCRKEPNARGGYIVEAYEYTLSVRRRLENVFEVGQIVEMELLKTKKMEEVLL